MEAAPPPARRLGFLRPARAFWHPHIALMLPLGFCMGVALSWTAGVHAMVFHFEWQSIFGLLVLLSAFHKLNFIWAPVFDRLPLPWLTNRLGRRRSWMLVTYVLYMTAMPMLGILGPSADPGTVLLLGLVAVLASSSFSAVVNAYRIELLEKSRYGAGEAVASIGLILGTVTAIPLIVASVNADIGTVDHVATLALLLVGVAIALFGPEPARAEEPDMAARENRFADAAARWGGAVAGWVSRTFLAPLTEFFTRPAWLAALAFLLLFKLGSAEADMDFPIKAVGSGASVVGIVAGAMVVYARGPLPGLLFAAGLLLLSNLAVLALNWASAESVWIGLAFAIRELGDGFGTVAVTAYAMGLCRRSYTATQFALFFSVMALGQALAGPKLAERLTGGLDGLFLSAALASLLSLLLLRVLWKRQQEEEAGP